MGRVLQRGARHDVARIHVGAQIHQLLDGVVKPAPCANSMAEQLGLTRRDLTNDLVKTSSPGASVTLCDGVRQGNLTRRSRVAVILPGERTADLLLDEVACSERRLCS